MLNRLENKNTYYTLPKNITMLNRINYQVYQIYERFCLDHNIPTYDYSNTLVSITHGEFIFRITFIAFKYICISTNFYFANRYGLTLDRSPWKLIKKGVSKF